MATLSCLDAVKSHSYSTSVSSQDILLPRKERVNTNKLCEINVVGKDLKNDEVKIYYVGYSNKYDECKYRDKIVIHPPKSTSHAPRPNFFFSTLACAIKKRHTPSRDDPAIRIQLSFNIGDGDLLQKVV